MHSARPYLIRGLIDWIVDNDWTPHVAVATDVDGVEVPRDRIQDNRIVLNVAAQAVRGFACGDDTLSFDARFGGRSFHVAVPLEAVLAVFARENGAGLAFQGTTVSGRLGGEEEGKPRQSDAQKPGESDDTPKGRPNLKLVE